MSEHRDIAQRAMAEIDALTGRDDINGLAFDLELYEEGVLAAIERAMGEAVASVTAERDRLAARVAALEAAAQHDEADVAAMCEVMHVEAGSPLDVMLKRIRAALAKG